MGKAQQGNKSAGGLGGTAKKKNPFNDKACGGKASKKKKRGGGRLEGLEENANKRKSQQEEAKASKGRSQTRLFPIIICVVGKILQGKGNEVHQAKRDQGKL